MQIFIIPDLNNIEECCAFSKANNLGWEFNDFMLPNVLDNADQTARIIEKYKSHDLPQIRNTHGAFLDITVSSSDSRIRKASDFRVKQSLELAGKMNCGSVIFHTNFIANFTDKHYTDGWVKQNAEYWRIKIAEYTNINILVENMFDMTPNLLTRLANEMKNVERFGVCLDYAHSVVFGSGKKSPYRFIRALYPYVKHIHLNDCDLKHDLHLAVGDGLIEWDNFADNYLEYMNGVPILFEVRGLEKQKRSLDFLQKLFARRGLII